MLELAIESAAKALVLLAAAIAVAPLLRRLPARITATLWAGVLAGTLLVAPIALLVPDLPVSIPQLLASVVPDPAPPAPHPLSAATDPPTVSRTVPTDQSMVPTASRGPLRWRSLLFAAWLVGAALAATRAVMGVIEVRRVLRRATESTDLRLAADLGRTIARLGLRRPVRLVMSDELGAPATIGVLRPVVVLPERAPGWLVERRRAVLLHELVHIVRLDWVARVVAQAACIAWWFNPLAWWARRRLIDAQELACDEEVIALGTPPASYAAHLLEIGRTVHRRAVPALSLARPSRLEERIMTLLDRRTHRRAGLAAVAPVLLVVALVVPALAAVQARPAADDPASDRVASPELKEAVRDLESAEERLQPELENLETELAPALQAVEEAIDVEDLAEIEEIARQIELEMAPHLERIERIHVDMAPIEAAMAEVRAAIEEEMADIDLRELEHRIQAHAAGLHDLEAQLRPHIEQIQAMAERIRPSEEEIRRLQERVERLHEERLAGLEERTRTIEKRAREIERRMEPLTAEMKRLAEVVETELRAEVAAVVRRHLEPVTGPGAPFTDTAAELLDDAQVRVEEGWVTVNISTHRAEGLIDALLGEHRTSGPEAFRAAASGAAEELEDLVLSLEE